MRLEFWKSADQQVHLPGAGDEQIRAEPEDAGEGGYDDVQEEEVVGLGGDGGGERKLRSC